MPVWVKGQSGNPNGRPRLSPETKRIRELAKQSAEEAFTLIAETMRDEEAFIALRVSAAKEVLKLAGVYAEAEAEASADPKPEHSECLTLPTPQLAEAVAIAAKAH